MLERLIESAGDVLEECRKKSYLIFRKYEMGDEILSGGSVER